MTKRNPLTIVRSKRKTVPIKALKSTGNYPLVIKRQVQISGARRIWGTLKTTTCAAVSSSLKCLTSFSYQIKVKRKYKTACDNHAVVKKWWFILRGSEERLQQLENEWELAATHTSWKIEPCSIPLYL